MEKKPFQQLAEEPEPGLLTEVWQFLVQSKKWWLLPVVVLLLLLGFLLFVSSTPFAPFLYPLF